MNFARNARQRPGFYYDRDGRELLDLELREGGDLLGISAWVEGRADAESANGERVRSALAARFPKFERFELFANHADAVAAAIDAARRVAGRNEIVRFRGCRHDFGDSPREEFRADAPRIIRFRTPAPDPHGQLFLKFNDTSTLEFHLSRAGSETAAVLIDPLPTTISLTIPSPDFLPRAMAACQASGTALILDEGRGGFRFFPRGAGHYYGMEPDLYILGSAHAGGLEFGAVGARGAFAEALAKGAEPPAESISRFLTLCEATAAPDFHAAICSLGARLARGLESFAAELSVPVEIGRFQSCVSLVFPRRGVLDPALPGRYDITHYQRLTGRMRGEHVYLPADPMVPMFLSSSHAPADIERAILLFRDVLESDWGVF